MAGSEDEYDEEYDEEEELYESEDEEDVNAATGSRNVSSRVATMEPEAQEWVGLKSFPTSVQSVLFDQLSKLRDQKKREVRNQTSSDVEVLCVHRCSHTYMEWAGESCAVHQQRREMRNRTPPVPLCGTRAARDTRRCTPTDSMQRRIGCSSPSCWSARMAWASRPRATPSWARRCSRHRRSKRRKQASRKWCRARRAASRCV